MKKLSLCLLSFLIPVTTLSAIAAKNLRLADLNKVEYQIDNGYYHIGTHVEKSSPAEWFFLDHYAFGDLNGDGLGDAVALVGLNTGGTGKFMSLVAIINDHGKAKAIDWVTLADRTGCTDLKIINGKIIYDALLHGPHDASPEPTVEKRLVYKLVNKKLVGPHHVDDY